MFHCIDITVSYFFLKIEESEAARNPHGSLLLDVLCLMMLSQLILKKRKRAHSMNTITKLVALPSVACVAAGFFFGEEQEEIKQQLK